MRKIWTINRFEGGVAPSKYLGNSNQAAWLKHFDIDSEVGVLKQQLDMADDGTGLDSDPDIQKFLATNSKVYALGEDSSAKACIYSKTISNILIDAWTKEVTVSSGALRTENNQMFLHYNDYLYFTEGGDITRYGPLSGSPSLTEGWGAANFGSAIDAAGGLVAHSYVYFHHDNKLASWDGGSTYNINALDIDVDYTIQDICIDAGGNNLLIAAHRGGNTYGDSQLYVWNRTSSSFYAIPTPDGIVKAVRNMGNFVRILCVKTAASSHEYGGVIIYDYAGGSLIKKHEYLVKGAILPLLERDAVFVDNNVIYFGLVYGDEATYTKSGMFRYGQMKVGLPETFLLEKDLKGTNTHEVRQIYALDRFKGATLCSYVNDVDAVNYVSKTQNGIAKNFTSTYESLILSTNENNKIHKFLIETNPLISGATITLKYKINEASSWTTVGTMTTAGEVYKEFYAPATGEFDNFRNLQLRIEMTGGDEDTKIREIKTYYDEISRR